MMGNLQLTVALMTYNRSGYLRQAVEAVLGQTWLDFKLLILDNHSLDDTPAFVAGLHDSRVTYVRHPQGSTPDENFYSAVSMSAGRYILVTHDDDVMEPTLLERQVSFLQDHPDLLGLATNVSLIDENGAALQPRLYNISRDRIFAVGEYVGIYLSEKLWLPTPTYLYRRDAILKYFSHAKWGKKLKEKTNTPSEDILMSFYLNSIGPIGLLAEPLLKYRQHSGQESRNVNQSRPLVDILTAIKKAAKAKTVLQKYTASISAALARFQVQDLFFRYSTAAKRKGAVRSITSLRSRLEAELPPSSRAVDAIVPLEIALHELGLEPFCPPERFAALWDEPADNGSTSGFRNWLRVAHAGGNLFDANPDVRRIAIFGSMMVAFLIALEAERAGVDVCCCIDSSPARIANTVFGVPIVSLMDPGSILCDVDAIILSNERDHEDAIIKIIAQHIPQPLPKVLSWKDLACSALQIRRRASVPGEIPAQPDGFDSRRQ